MLRFLACLLVLGLALTPVFAKVGRVFAPGEIAVRDVLSGDVHPDIDLWDLVRWRTALLALYEGRDFVPLWFSGRRLTRAGHALIQELRDAENRGLRAADYESSRLAYLAMEPSGKRAAGPEEIALVDVAFSVTAARLAIDLHAGRVDPRDVGYDLDVPHAQLDVSAAVETLAGAPDVSVALDDLEPDLRHYDLLKTALARYRLLAGDPALTRLPALPKFPVAAGESYAGAPALRRLLRALGDLRGSNDPPPELQMMLDSDLASAVARFQSRHGLPADGVLGPKTLRQLTTPLELRARQIVLSLERARWLPSLDSPPIMVNIPQFRLFAFRTTQDIAQEILQMDVIVGEAFPGRETPVFAADMRYIVLRPYWDVPFSIMAREMLPLIWADPDWVTRNGYELVLGQRDDALPQPVTAANIDLLARGELRLRQKPGPGNALGLAKFMFPNRHNVYMHDTPAQELFGQARRAFSHGCIRVADPIALIRHVLRDDPRWTTERITAAMRVDGPVRIALPRSIRVFIIYGTALATEAGETLFFEDIYQHDARLDALLTARRR